MIESICSNCGVKKVFNDDKIGKKYKCPDCESVNLIEKIDLSATSQKEINIESKKSNSKSELTISEAISLTIVFLIIWGIFHLFDIEWSIVGWIIFVLFILSLLSFIGLLFQKKSNTKST